MAETVHPRMRGADVMASTVALICSTVHPRMRGADFVDAGDCLSKLRFIPACAGLIFFATLSMPA